VLLRDFLSLKQLARNGFVVVQPARLAAIAARRMTPDIALILGIDGIATGSIYVLVGLGLVLIFSVTRVVFDLNGPQPYQVFPSGKTIIVKVGTPGTEAAKANPAAEPELVSITYPPSEAPPSTPTPAPVALPPPKPRLVVSFRNGLLSINSDQASLSEVLFAVHQRTGAEIAIPAGAEQEKVVVQLGPAPAPEVLAHLLNGTRFNFLILSSASNPRDLDQVILSPRGEGGMSSPSPQLQPMAVEDERTMQPNAVPPPQPEPPPPADNPNPPADGQAPPPPPPNENPN